MPDYPLWDSRTGLLLSHAGTLSLNSSLNLILWKLGWHRHQIYLLTLALKRSGIDDSPVLALCVFLSLPLPLVAAISNYFRIPSLPSIPLAFSWETVGRCRQIRHKGRWWEQRDKEMREKERERQRRRGVHRQAMASQVKKRTAHSSRPAELLHSPIYNNPTHDTMVETPGRGWCKHLSGNVSHNLKTIAV